MLGVAEEVRTNSYGLLPVDTQMLVNQKKLTFINFIWTLEPSKGFAKNDD